MDNLNNFPEIEQEHLTFTQDFKRRLQRTRTTRWIRFAVVSILFCLFVVWLGNPWVSIAWLLLLDIYITGYIPWTWWKGRKGPVRTVMAWVDAIIYALVIVYFIFAFIGQNYTIPSSSLEKSLLVGDYLWVSKVVYGPRVPQTPVHFPLAQHTMPVIGTKSYLDKPQLDYHRLPGLRSIERGDIVVFNFPEGDTVLSNFPTEDYYLICERLQQSGIADPKSFVRLHPEKFGEMLVRPVDRRENYVKRTIGLPGEWLEIRNDSIYIDGKLMEDPEHVQYNYIIPVNAPIARETWQKLGVRTEDSGTAPVNAEYTGYQFYNVPLTEATKKQVEKLPQVNGPLIRESESGLYDLGNIFPHGDPYGWKRTNMSAFWIPKRGVTLHVTLNNLPLYGRCIETYEGNKLQVKDGVIYINDKPSEYYTFKYDYYWMMGDNRDRSLDSRYWGFVPEDHIVGSPMFILVSLDAERSLTESGKIRWDRILLYLIQILRCRRSY
ncbi:MAG: signal peptidase I, partial [Muribaculaceae bacterium]|nr:signal peptidase I [Muribaculaceae bacterium]